jgi:TRAP-type mannitol/chloroaromatic compound transport system substrate-binding protein
MRSDSTDRETPGLDRRDFLGRALTGAAGGTVALACGEGPRGASADAPAVHTQQNVQWRLVSSFPRSLDALYGSAERLAERLSALTDGRFMIRPYPAGELVPPFGVMDAVQQGTVQLSHTASYYYTGKAQVLAFDTGVPFGLTARQQSAWLYDGGGLELVQEMYAPFDIITFPAGNTGAQMGGWFKREINTPTDVRGLKIRIPSLGGEVMARLGATVQVLPGGEIYPALERGAIDATEWVGPYDDEKLGFHRAARFYYYPGWWEPGPSMSFQVNRRAWESLPKLYQEAFRTAARSAGEGTLTIYDARNHEALGRLVAQGTQLRRFSPEIMRAAHRASFEIMEEHAARDASYRKVHDAWKQFREASFRWFGTAEHAYAEFAFGAGGADQRS